MGHDGPVITPPIPLIWAKLRPPVLPDHVVSRDRLIDELSSPQAALTAIVAPPGYGKTTAAVQLASRLDAPVAWVTLEPADNDPARFWTYVAAALCAADVPGADGTYEHLAGGDDGLDVATTTLKAAVEAFGGPVTLVLDDLHVVHDETIERSLGDWLRFPLANLRIVCTSRSDLPLPVGRLRSQGLLTEARLDDLAFDTEDSAHLLGETFGLGALTDEQLSALAARTEGWPVGLYLAGITLRDEPRFDEQLARFAGDTRHLTEYLAAETMSAVDDDTKAFVLATSIVSILDADLADALTGHVGSLRMLRRLVADNVFTSSLDEAATMFRYHPLFREHLQSSLREQHPEQVTELHRRASRWYESNGDVDEAIVHAIAAGDSARAQNLISANFLLFSNSGHFGTITNWVAALGEDADLSAETAMMMAWITLNLRRHDEVDYWLDLAKAAARTEHEQAMVSLQSPEVLAHRARHDGDVGALSKYAAEAMAMVDATQKLLDADVETGPIGQVEPSIGAAWSVSGCASYWAGDFDDARQRFAAAVPIARNTDVHLETTFCYQYLAAIEADAGDPDAAIAHADQALSHVNPTNERHHQPSLAHLARSIALSRSGRPGDAEAALSEARRVAQLTSEPLYDAAIELQQARLHHLVGDQEAARAAVRSAKAIVAELPDARFDARIRATENEIRFVAREVDDLPVGARELTDREQAVLVLLPHGLSRRDLAAQLHVSENTVKTHLTSIRHKLGVSGRDSIVDRARELGLFVDDGPPS